MDLLKILFIVVLFLFPFGEVFRIQSENGIAVRLNDLGIAILFAVWLVYSFLNRKKISGFILLPISLFAAIGFFSLLLSSKLLDSQEFIVSFLYLLRWILYAGLFFIVSGFDASFKKKIPYFLIAVGTITVLGGYLQYFLYPALRYLIYLGWDEHLYRMFSSFLDPNFAGIIFVLTFILALGLFFSHKGSKWILGLIAIFSFSAIFLTYSRSAILMLVVSLLFFMILTKRRSLLIGTFILFVLMILISSQFAKSEGTNLFRVTSSFARFGSSENALAIFRENPILGVGFNSYRYAQHRMGFANDQNWRFSHGGAGVDNSFLFVLATTGIAGFLSYVYIWYKIIKENKKSKKIIPGVIIASSLGLFVASFFVNALFYPFIMQWMWILIGSTENS